MENNENYGEVENRSLSLNDLLSPRDLRPLLNSFSRFLSTPLWITDKAGKVFVSSDNKENMGLSEFPPSIVNGESNIEAVINGEEHYIVSPLISTEEPVGVLVASAIDELDTEKFYVLREMIHILLRAGWKNAVTAEMHTAAMNVSYRELEEQNRRLNSMLKKIKNLDQAKANFMQTVSHELKTPLTSIMGYAELVKEGLAGDINDEQKQYLKTILEKSQVLIDMITNILDITRMGAGREDLQLNMHLPSDIINTAISMITEQANSRQIKISVEVQPDLGPIMCDAVRIYRALVALLSNAIKFSPEQSEVKVKAAITLHESFSPAISPFDPINEEVMAFSVEDQGIGIPENELGKIFDSFYQVDNSSTREFGGLGLGLTLAKNFIEAHGGKIEVISAVGKGTRFTILLPLNVADLS